MEFITYVKIKCITIITQRTEACKREVYSREKKEKEEMRQLENRAI